MECVVLGYGGMMPMPSRFTTSVLVRRGGRMLLFDAGEGIQIAFKQAGVGIAALDVVAVSHLHADHLLGLPGIMMFRSQNEDPGPLTIVGPPGIERFVRHTVEDLGYRIDFDYTVVEWGADAESRVLDWHGASLGAARLAHSAFCLGFRLEEPVRPGRFHPERAAAIGVPPGPLFGALQGGEAVSLTDGRRVAPEDVLGPPRRGRIVTYATDTRPCAGLESLLAGADLAFVEGMFARRHAAEAEAKMHMTAAEAAGVAARAGASRLVLVHLSPRYDRADEAELEAEARAAFPLASIARPLGRYEVPLPD